MASAENTYHRYNHGSHQTESKINDQSGVVVDLVEKLATAPAPEGKGSTFVVQIQEAH